MYGAIDAYTEVIENYPGSVYIPGALYKTAKIDEILGNLTRAGLSYRALIETYPVPEYYDKSCAALAGILERQSQYNEAAEYLKRMIFYDPSFSEDEIKALIEELESVEEKL